MHVEDASSQRAPASGLREERDHEERSRDGHSRAEQVWYERVLDTREGIGHIGYAWTATDGRAERNERERLALLRSAQEERLHEAHVRAHSASMRRIVTEHADAGAGPAQATVNNAVARNRTLQPQRVVYGSGAPRRVVLNTNARVEEPRAHEDANDGAPEERQGHYRGRRGGTRAQRKRANAGEEGDRSPR